MIDVATWGWPQITLLILSAIGLGVNLSSAKPGNVSALVSSLIATGITYTLLICGGFFGGHH